MTPSIIIIIKFIRLLKFSELKSFATLNFSGPSKVRYLHFSRAIYDILLSSSQKEEKEAVVPRRRGNCDN